MKLEYPVVIEPLGADDGGGFLATVQDAVAAWIEEARQLSRPIPAPSRRHVAAE